MSTKDKSNMQKNEEQSRKALNGIALNKKGTSVLERIDNGKTIRFIKAELSFKKRYFVSDYIGKGVSLQADHGFILVNDKKQEILYIMADSTTTLRERIANKLREGNAQDELIDVIEDDLFQRFPEYQNYKVTHVTIVVFPTTMDDGLKKLKEEKRNVREFCIELNHHLLDLRSTEQCHKIDAAMTWGELERVVRQIVNNLG